MKRVFWSIAGIFGFVKPKPLNIIMGIWGITEDGCYIVGTEDGRLVKSGPIIQKTPRDPASD